MLKCYVPDCVADALKGVCFLFTCVDRLKSWLSLDCSIVAFDDQMMFAIEGNAGMTPQVFDHVFYQYFEA